MIKVHGITVFLQALGAGLLVGAAALVVALLWPIADPPWLAHSGPVALVDVTIIDVEHGESLAGQTVVLRDGHIERVGPASAEALPAGVRILDARGQFLIPGLWDMHTHSIKRSPQFHHALYIANGVTSVRDMSGCLSEDDSYWACPHDRRRWTNEAVQGQRVSPRYPLQSSYQTNGGNEVPEGLPAFFRLESLEHAEELAAFYRGQGVDFIKTYSELAPQQFAWIARSAREQGLGIAGHRPVKVSLETALAMGQRSFEHGRLFLFECFGGAQAFRSAPDPLAAYNATLRLRLLTERDEAACAQHMRNMAEAGAWWVPTLTTLRMAVTAAQPAAHQDPRLADIPWLRRKLLWGPDARRAAAEPLANDGRSIHAHLFDLASRDVGEAHAAGVRILTGTDTSDTLVFPGSSLHGELQMFVDAGLTPAQALRAATIAAAEFAGAQTTHGTIAPGKVADLVLLEANPLADIANTRRIAGVFIAGHHHDARSLQALRQFARAQASSVRANLRLLWDMLASPLMRRQLAD
ncbi:hypothetical protein DWB85_13020 [Seongchinamella sediminis]|uniref:Amidohydrolase-related domain-containing protein n=1 Tax=Seongchinamella sediminis TaxID=2283635 RepID=A0A3L7DUG8_9GAMM|nr:amidohydrolase family protein [Seongchinamella sediminis]RLQ21227.1 hypothetical protein DWB85_13020 [Seongchinamella sediminis]